MSQLAKWPRLLVAGDPVTEQQANEIIIRTTGGRFLSNDHEWIEQVCALYGIPEGRWGIPDWDAARDIYRQLGGLDLDYLVNHRIMSLWGGGPHGWCDWDGSIGCSTYNIGKWPTVDEITQEWQAIAAAFPYLHLRAQAVPDEGRGRFAAAEWTVSGGAVTVAKGSFKLLSRPTDPIFRAFTPGGERGVSLERLREAIEQVRTSRGVR